jgi:predicted O-methyltransferase YrrM
MLYDAATGVDPSEAIVEIGSHHGRSTLILASAKPQGVQLVAVDPYGDGRWGGGEEALEVFRTNLERHGFAHEVELLRLTGAEGGRAWTGREVGLLFVDGAHDFGSVTSDLSAWLPHLSPHAQVMMHDAYSSPGVTLAAFHAMFGSRVFAYRGSSRSLVAFHHTDHGLLGSGWSAFRMLTKLPWLARNLTVKLAIRRGWRSIPLLLGHAGPGQPF